MKGGEIMNEPIAIIFTTDGSRYDILEDTLVNGYELKESNCDVDLIELCDKNSFITLGYPRESTIKCLSSNSIIRIECPHYFYE